MVFKFFLKVSFILSLFISISANAFDSFVVSDIRVEGVQRISAGTVFNYLPIKIGDTVSEKSIPEALKALYRTGFFKDIKFYVESSDVLVVSALERPAIADIEFDGNKDIADEDLEKSLKQLGLYKGRVYDKALLTKVLSDLKRQYFARGKYSVRIESVVTPLVRNRVNIKIDISEGKITKIHQISIIGNNNFTEEELLDEIKLDSNASIFSSDDQYSKHKLSADLDKIKQFYLDKGYVNFTVNSTQVSITPDKKGVYITINLTEGKKYTVNQVKISGNLIIEQEKLDNSVKLRKGDVFSRRAVSETTQEIVRLLGEKGYAFAKVNPLPDFDEEKNTIDINFFIDPGNKTYVRRINIYGNELTADHVIRRELRQFEQSLLSTNKIKRGKERLNTLGFFKDVKVETKPVLGTSDLIDVNYTVEEQSTGSINAGLGFSQSEGLMFNFSVTQRNFLGTGNNYSVGVNTSDVNTLYHFSVTEPYFTKEGISRTWYVTHKKTDQDAANLSSYYINRDALGLSFSVPVNEYNRYGFGFDFESLNVELPGDTSYTSQNIVDFVNNDGGDYYNTLKFNASWKHDSRNRHLFPDQGTLVDISSNIAVPGSEFQYYKLGYKQTHFFPLMDKLTMRLTGNVSLGGAYSSEAYPPFENFFAGGMSTIRGYKDNTLGVVDDKTGKAIGGKLRTIANAELIIPFPGVKDSSAYRLAVFVDGGYVYQDVKDFDFNDFRYASGISAIWVSPLGLLRFSLGYALNEKPSDETQIFQFTFGQQF
ncbi:MAG: outer membrane protein assembly factor BamA [Gammaproteobacteria bacterium]|nr:outer membrane protein assembly factor BamA [Gammaproteobacteria bacterium]